MSTKQNIIHTVKNLFHALPNSPRIIHRGPTNIAGSGSNNWADEVDNAYPTAKQLRDHCCTVFIQFSTRGPTTAGSDLVYLIAYPHQDIDTVLRSYITAPGSRALRKKKAHGVNYKDIREGRIAPFFCKTLGELEQFIKDALR